MAQNLQETVQILQHQGSCLDKRFRQVYPVCLAEEMELLDFTFPLTGPEVMAPVPQPLKQEQGLQVSRTLAQPQRRVFLGEAKPPAMMTVGKESKAHFGSPPPISESNFAMGFAHLREDYRKVQKRPNTSQEQSPQQTGSRKSTESGDSTDSEISKETELLEITSPRKSGQTWYDQYLAEGGQPLIVRFPLPEDYKAANVLPSEDYAKGVISKCPVQEHLGPEVSEEMDTTELEQGDIADEAYWAWQAHEEELFTWMKCREEDLRAQKKMKWEKETQQWELKKKKREEEEAKKQAAFQKTEEYNRQKERTERSNANIERCCILTNLFLEGFSKVPPKTKETPGFQKPTHLSEGRSSGQFGQPPHRIILKGLLDLKGSHMTTCTRMLGDDSLGGDEY